MVKLNCFRTRFCLTLAKNYFNQTDEARSCTCSDPKLSNLNAVEVSDCLSLPEYSRNLLIPAQRFTVQITLIALKNGIIDKQKPAGERSPKNSSKKA